LPEGLASLGAKKSNNIRESQRELVFFYLGFGLGNLIKGGGDT
jgi:hypothetical protein